MEELEGGGVYVCVCFHVCMFTCLYERKKKREAMRGEGVRREGERG